MPHDHWKTTTFTGALRLTGMTAPFVYDGAMNGKVILDYVEQVLIPTLSKGDIVVVDNLPAHKAAVQGLCSCRPTAPTSIPSRTLSQNSKRSYAPRPKEPSQLSGMRLTPSLISLRQPNAPTTSRPPDMTQIKQDVL